MKKHLSSLFVLTMLLCACGGETITPTPVVEVADTPTPEPPSATTEVPPTEEATMTPTSEATPTETSVPFEVFRDVAYADDPVTGSGSTPSQILDIYLPDENARKSLTLFVVDYGGGDKRRIVNRLARKGYAVVFAHVRFGNYPEPVQDTFCSWAWVHAHAGDYGIEPTRIVVLGHSGGGVQAAHLAAVDDPALYMDGCPHPFPEQKMLATVVIAGGFDYRTEEDFADIHNQYTPGYFGGTQDQVPDVWAEASPVTWVDGSEPPFYLIHGDLDDIVLPRHSENFATVLEAAGVEVELVLIPGLGHFDIMERKAMYDVVVNYVARLEAQP